MCLEHTTQLRYKEFEVAKGVIRIRKLEETQKHNGQKEKDKTTNNDLQNTIQKTQVEQHEPHQHRG